MPVFTTQDSHFNTWYNCTDCLFRSKDRDTVWAHDDEVHTPARRFKLAEKAVDEAWERNK